MAPRKRAKAKVEVADEQLRDYELVLITNPELVEEKFDSIIDNLSQLITNSGGLVSEVDRWGKRRLAYPIGHFGEGIYVLARFKLKPAASIELEASLRISEDVLRHLLIKLNS
jgi:small subunit ribosomal protein S6